MFRPGFPRLSHPEVAHAIPSVGFIAQVYRRVRLLVSLTTVGVQLTDQQRTAQAPMTAQDILEGRMIIEVGMAVVRPAEFIILKFAHKMQVS